MDFHGNDIEHKHIVLGVCGGIAAYKACELVRSLQKLGATVTVLMTPDAQAFVGKLTFEALTRRPVIDDPLAVAPDGTPWHIALAQQADALMVVPCTANMLAKLAHGLADCMVSTTAISWTNKPMVVVPAMNPRMWEHPQVSHNARVVAALPHTTLVHPSCGLLACGETGVGHLPDEQTMLMALYKALHPQAGLYAGVKAIVTAGGTLEAIDPARTLTNRSSGKMGVAFADELHAMGAEVTLLATTHLHLPNLEQRPYTVLRVETAQQMLDSLIPLAETHDLLVKAAAVSDYHVAQPSQTKLKRTTDKLSLTLVPNPDVLATVAQANSQLYCLGFAAETDEAAETLAQNKMTRKGIDALCLNDVSRSDIGFESDENEVTLFMKEVETPKHFKKAPKFIIAQQVLSSIYQAVILKQRLMDKASKAKPPALNAPAV